MNKKKQNYLPAGRQKRFLISVFGGIIIIYSTLFSSETDSLSFFPMHVDDRWVYWDYTTSSIFYNTINGDTIDSLGNHWYVWNRNEGSNHFYYRMSGDSLHYRYRLHHTTEIIYRLSTNIGYCWYVFGDSLNGGRVGMIDTTNAGSNSVSIDYYDGFCENTSLWYYTDNLHQGIGLTSRVLEGGGGFDLLGAVVDEIVFGDTSLGVENEYYGDSKPESFSIQSIYPNPFNSYATIFYDVRTHSFLVLEIYNIRGELIKTLFQKQHISGKYKVNWDGTNNHQTEAASGIYFVVLKDNYINYVEKSILLR